jgi:hypothetical protein
MGKEKVIFHKNPDYILDAVPLFLLLLARKKSSFCPAIF